LPGHRATDGRLGGRPQRTGGPGLRPHLRRDVHPAQSHGRRRRHRQQPAPAAPPMSIAPPPEPDIAFGESDVPAAIATVAPAIAARSRPRSFGRPLRGAPPTAWFGLVVIALYLVAAIFAPLIAPFPESEVIAGGYEPWGPVYILGTDQL